ncbi:MAG: hypothetical protein JWO03_218 [Bacteroidetes bacterium]|nr:hypothetical protein [Bacteroidota bacterium]
MRWDAAEVFYLVIIAISLTRAFIRYAESQEATAYEEEIEVIYADGMEYGPEDEKEKMTPTYMPPPAEAGDGCRPKQKEI